MSRLNTILSRSHVILKQYQAVYIAITAFVMYELNQLTLFVYNKFDGWTVEYSGVVAALIGGYVAMLKWSLENSRKDTRYEND